METATEVLLEEVTRGAIRLAVRFDEIRLDLEDEENEQRERINARLGSVEAVMEGLKERVVALEAITKASRSSINERMLKLACDTGRSREGKGGHGIESAIIRGRDSAGTAEARSDSDLGGYYIGFLSANDRCGY
ncbi:unnamed protein product [Closterium sp. Yama58-4]|nr:unnamed protein product [Closterium sp. Yama58-4]